MTTDETTIDALLDQRLAAIESGVKQAIRHEVDSLYKQGLPIIVAENGTIIDLQTGKPVPKTKQ